MTEPTNDLPGSDIVHTGAWHAALEALMMNDPHPKGYLSGTGAARISRALYAYEREKLMHPIEYDETGGWKVRLPTPGDATASVLAMEARDE